MGISVFDEKMKEILRKAFGNDNYEIGSVRLKDSSLHKNTSQKEDSSKKKDEPILVAEFDLIDKEASENTPSCKFDISLNQERNEITRSRENKPELAELAETLKKQLQPVRQELAETLSGHPSVRLKALF